MLMLAARLAINTEVQPSPLRVGLFGIGLDAYWPQFAGLKDRLEGYLARVADKLARPGVEIVNLGLIDNPDRAHTAGHEFRRADVDLIVLHVTTYALSSTVLPVVRRAKVPVIVLNLNPAPAIDYATINQLTDRTRMTGEWLAFCAAWFKRSLPCPRPAASRRGFCSRRRLSRTPIYFSSMSRRTISTARASST